MEAERLDVQLGLWDLLRSHVRIREIALVAPAVRIVRQGPGDFNFSDLLGRARRSRRPDPQPLDRVGRARASGARPAACRGPGASRRRPSGWSRGSTRRAGPDDPGGRRAGLVDVGARINEARLAVHAEPVRLAPLRIAARVTLEGFETRRLNEYIYIPRGTPYMPRGGGFGLNLTVDVDSDAQEIQKATVAGTLVLEREAFLQTGRPDPFLSASRFKIEIKEADLIARRLTLAGVDLEGLDLAVRRDARGVIDLIDLLTPKPPPGGPTKPAGPASAAPTGRRTLFPVIQGLARGFEEIRIERFTLAPSTLTFVDEHVKPAARLVLTKLRAQADNFTWPVKAPMALTLYAGLPGGGTLDIKGPVTVLPFDTELTVSIRDAPVEPYQPYIPIPARLSGRYFGDSRNRIAFRDGKLLAQSKGNSWAQNVEIREPGASRPAIRVERMELLGIDFDWPTRAVAVKAGFRRPRVEVERSIDGSFNLRRLFTPPAEAGAPPRPEPKPATPPVPPSKGLLETMRLEFGEIRIEDGHDPVPGPDHPARVLAGLSRLALTVTGYGNRPGPPRQARTAERRRRRRGARHPWRDRPARVARLRRPRRRAAELQAAQCRPVRVGRHRVGHQEGRPPVQVPVQARWQPALGRQRRGHRPAPGRPGQRRRRGQATHRPAARADRGPHQGPERGDPRQRPGHRHTQRSQVRARRRDLDGGQERAGEHRDGPVQGARPAVLGGGGAQGGGAQGRPGHLRGGERGAVAGDGGAPAAGGGLPAALTLRQPRAVLDAEPDRRGRAQDEAVSARLRDFQREQGLDDAAALAAYYRARLPDVPLPATVEEQLALLREREPVPDALVADLGHRRVEATRERLVTAEGIPPARLTAPSDAGAAASPAPATDTAAGQGRVEFTVVAGE